MSNNIYEGSTAELCERFGITTATFYKRINRGIPFEKALSMGRLRGAPVIYTVQGVTGNVSELCRHFNKKVPTVLKRMSRTGMSLEEALLTDLKRGRSKVYCIDDISGTISELAEKFNISVSTVYSRMSRGFSLERALKQKVRKRRIYKVVG